MPHAKHNCNIVLQVISCMLHKLSFRRFTYGNLVTTSPRANTDCVDSDYKSAAFLTYGHVYIIMKMLEYSWAKMPHAKHNCNIVLQVISCMLHKLSFRRFTYGNLVTTSPSSK